MASSANGSPREQSDASDAPIACVPKAIPAAEREAHFALAKRVWSELPEARQELPDGYALQFGPEQFALLAAFVANERLCCPFLRFTLEVTPRQGPLWLRITGDERVTAFLKGELAQAEEAPEADWDEAAIPFRI
jgi:hypothetical protein